MNRFLLMRADRCCGYCTRFSKLFATHATASRLQNARITLLVRSTNGVSLTLRYADSSPRNSFVSIINWILLFLPFLEQCCFERYNVKISCPGNAATDLGLKQLFHAPNSLRDATLSGVSCIFLLAAVCFIYALGQL